MNSKFIVTKTVLIEHPKSWSQKELKQLAEDICSDVNLGLDWDLHNVSFEVEEVKVIKEQ